MSILEVSGLRKVYTSRLGGSRVEALRNVSFTVEQGEYVAIMGESGSGKTTLLNILAALDEPTAGTVRLDGHELGKIREKDAAAFRRDNLGFVFQEFNLLDTFTLEDNIYLPLVLMGMSYEDMRARLLPVARELGLTELLKKYPYEVSGGQKQRAAVARALITDPQLILADEPTMEAKETLAVEQKRSIAQAAAQLINANDFVFIDAGSTTLEMVRALTGDALKASYLTNGVAHARALAQKGCRVYLPGGLLRPQTEAIVGAPTVSIIQQYNFTKAFMGANGVALEAGFTTPDPEEAAVKAAAVHRARETWFLVDDAKFARIYPAVIADLQGGAILTNRCPNPKYKQFTLVKETEV